MNDPRVSDPNVFGPGMWAMLHIMSANARTDDQKKAVMWMIWTLASNLKCNECKKHFNKFIKQYPPENYMDQDVMLPNGKKIPGLYVWTYKAHSNVEKFTGKPIPSLEDTYELWGHSEVGVCYGDCSAGHGATATAENQVSAPISMTSAAVLPTAKIEPIKTPLTTMKTSDGRARVLPSGFVFNYASTPYTEKVASTMIPRATKTR